MAMQPRAWMTSYLFSAWISHFIASIRRHSVISPEHRHLLILDGHNSHVILEVARLAKNVGLDLITLPSHTSHALQPLDVSVFKPFKQYFREYRDYWTSRNRDQSATKEVLAQWVSLGLRKALSVCNISSGFRRTGIYPLNSQAVDAHLTPSEVYRSHGRLDPADAPSSMEEAVIGDQEEETGDNQQTDGVEEGHDVPSGPAALYPLASSEQDIAADFSREPQAGTKHFFVGADPYGEAVDSDVAALDTEAPMPESITQFLQLPRFTPSASSHRRDPIVDFAKSVILTSSEYEEAAAIIITASEDATKEKQRQKQQREESKKRKLEEREEAMARRAASREEAQRLKDLKAAEKAETQPRRAAEREEAARVKAERAYQLAMARAEKAAQRSSRVDDLRFPRASRASETVEVRQNAEERLRARGCWTGESTSEGAALLHHNLQTSSSFAPVLHTPPYYPPVTAQPLHAQYFFPSPSSGFPSLSQFDVSPHSTRPITQNLNQFQVPASARSHRCNTSMRQEGGRLEEGPGTSRCNVTAARPSCAGKVGDGERGPQEVLERVREEARMTLRKIPAREKATGQARLEP